MRTKEEILNLVKEEDVEFIRLQFTDMCGNLKNIAITVEQLNHALDNRCVFDGSALYGFKRGSKDMYLYPDPDSFVILPWRPQHGRVARLLCDVYGKDGVESPLSARGVLKKVINKAKEKGYTFYIDTECEFFLFHTDENGVPTTVTHEQAGYLDVGPVDLGENARRDMVLSLEEMGFEIESSHHECAPAQHEIDFKEAEPLQAADSIVTFKSAVRATAKRFGLHATFMPKPKKGVAGSGMHLNISVYKDGKNVFNSNAETDAFMAGIMEHAKAMCAVTNPLVNSYKRLISGIDLYYDDIMDEIPKNALMDVRSIKGEDTKVELRFPDPSANPYLALAVVIAAGLDGLERHPELNKAMLSCESRESKMAYLPVNLKEAVDFTINDDFMRAVLGEKFTDIYCKLKYQEWNEYMEQVSDWEIEKYINRV